MALDFQPTGGRGRGQYAKGGMDQWACHAGGDGVVGCVAHFGWHRSLAQQPRDPPAPQPMDHRATVNSPGSSDGQSATVSDASQCMAQYNMP